MQATIREFTRRFPSFRREALAGREVRMRDRAGNDFVFRTIEARTVSLAEAMGEIMGSVRTGRRRKSMAGYGRD